MTPQAHQAAVAAAAIHPPTLSAAELTKFREQGYLRLGHVGTPGHVQALRDRIDAIMLGEVRAGRTQIYISAKHFTSESDVPRS